MAAKEKRETSRRQRRREEIYEVSIQLFNERGYATTSMQEIAERVGVLKGSLYYYLESKEELLEGIFTQADQEFLGLIDAALALESSEVDRLQAFARSWCLWYLQNIERGRIYVNDWTQLTGKRRKHVAKMRREYGDQVQKMIDRAVAELGVESDVDSHFARLYVFSAVNGLPMWYRRDGSSSVEEVATNYAKLIVRTVLCVSPVPWRVPAPGRADAGSPAR